MTNKTKDLVAAGHALANEMTGAPSALVRELATQLDVQRQIAENSQREFRAADATIHNLELKVAEVVAENAGLKAAAEFATAPDMWIEQADGMLDYRYVDWYVDVLKAAMETPATDAFLDEVRAQVWIEGSEPAEFGRYWVRYETDVGPQYCSAKWMEHNFCAGSDTNIHKIWLADHSRSMNSLRGVTHYTKLPESLEAIAAQLRQGAAL